MEQPWYDKINLKRLPRGKNYKVIMMMITMPMIITIVSGQPGQEKRLGGGGGGAGTVAAAPSTVGKVVACPRWAKTSKTHRQLDWCRKRPTDFVASLNRSTIIFSAQGNILNAFWCFLIKEFSVLSRMPSLLSFSWRKSLKRIVVGNGEISVTKILIFRFWKLKRFIKVTVSCL